MDHSELLDDVEVQLHAIEVYYAGEEQPRRSIERLEQISASLRRNYDEHAEGTGCLASEECEQRKHLLALMTDLDELIGRVRQRGAGGELFDRLASLQAVATRRPEHRA